MKQPPEYTNLTLPVPPENFDWGEAGPPLGSKNGWYHLDHNHLIKFMAVKELGNGFAGLTHFHRMSTNVWCGGGAVIFSHHPYAEMMKEQNPELQTWEVVSFDPFTLDKSLKCTICTSHGFIVGNSWLDATPEVLAMLEAEPV